MNWKIAVLSGAVLLLPLGGCGQSPSDPPASAEESRLEQDDDFALREQALTGRETDLARRETELSQWEADLAQKEAELSQREEDLADREQAALDKEASLAQRQSAMETQETSPPSPGTQNEAVRHGPPDSEEQQLRWVQWLDRLRQTDNYGGTFFTGETGETRGIYVLDMDAFLLSDLGKQVETFHYDIKLMQADYSLRQLQSAAERLSQAADQYQIFSVQVEENRNGLMVGTMDLSDKNKQAIMANCGVDNIIFYASINGMTPG